MQQEHYDILIRHASIVDGTNAPRYAGDIGIRGDRIVRIGELAGASGAIEIDLAGVTRCDSAAVALLLEWVRVAERRGARLAFRNLPASLAAIASISDVDQLLPRAG